MKDYLIVGAGLYGSVMAYKLAKIGKKVFVIDEKSHIGGICYSEFKNGITIHRYGAHIFHTNNADIWYFINQFCKLKPYINSPIALYKDKIYNLPFNMNTFYQLWKTKTPEQAIKKISSQIEQAKIKLKTDTPKNLEEKALLSVGKDIYETFIKNYTEKQWGRKCNELPPEIITRIPLRFNYDNNYFNDTYQGIPESDYGYTELFENLLSNENITVELNRPYKDSDKRLAKNIIYTGSIDEYYNYELGHLQYRTIGFLDKWFDKTNSVQGNPVINYTDNKYEYTRSVEHGAFFPKYNKGLSLITYEYPMDYIAKTGQNRLYPIPTKENLDMYNDYIQLNNSRDKIIFGGRLGHYKYIDMDKTIKMALDDFKDLTL